VTSLGEAIDREKHLNDTSRDIEVDFLSSELRAIKNTEDKSKLEGSVKKAYKQLLRKYKLKE